jgi:hypothetical protein
MLFCEQGNVILWNWYYIFVSVVTEDCEPANVILWAL